MLVVTIVATALCAFGGVAELAEDSFWGYGIFSYICKKHQKDMATFTIYTYLFSPVTRGSQADLFAGDAHFSPAEAYDRRHTLLDECFAEATPFFTLHMEKKDYGCKLLARHGGIIVFRLANSRKWKHEVQFKEVDDRDEPSCLVIVDNREAGIQSLCIQCKQKAFAQTRRVAALLEEAFNRHLRPHRLRVGIQAKYHTSEFWQTVDKHAEGLDWVEFHFPYPNLPQLSDKVAFIKHLALETNSEPSVRLTGQNGEKVLVDKRLEFIVRAVEYCAASGRPVLLKPKGGRRVEVGTLSPVKEELPDAVFEKLGETDLFDTALEPVSELLNRIKLWYDA